MQKKWLETQGVSFGLEGTGVSRGERDVHRGLQ